MPSEATPGNPGVVSGGVIYGPAQEPDVIIDRDALFEESPIRG
jgi:hypothetical protein